MAMLLPVRRGGRAQIGTVKVEANAIAHVGNLLLCQAGVRAGGTGLGAFETRFNTVSQLLNV